MADPPWDMGPMPLPYSSLSLDEIKALPVREISDNLDHDAHLYLWTPDSYLRAAFDIARGWGFHHSATIVWCKRSASGVGMGGIWPSNVEFVLFCRRPKVTTRPDVLHVTTYLADAADRAGVTRTAINRHFGFSTNGTCMANWWLSRNDRRCACPTDAQWSEVKALVKAGDDVDGLVREINARKGTLPPVTLERTPGRWFDWAKGAHSEKPEAFLDLVEQVSPSPYLELFARRARFGWDYAGDGSLGTVEIPGLRAPA